MEKKRILILPSWYPDPLHPLNGIFVHEQAVVLSRKYDIAVLSIRPIGWRQFIRVGAGKRSETRFLDGVPIHVERSFIWIPRTRWFNGFAYFGAVHRGLRQLINSWGTPDLLHAHVILPMGFAAAKLGEKYNIPVVLTEHTSPFSVHLQTPIQRWMVAYSFRRTTKILTVSASLAETMKAFAPNIRPEILGELVKTNFFTPLSQIQPASEKQQFRFLVVGFLVEQKGISILLKAVSILHSRGFYQFEVVIGGDGALRNVLEEKAGQLKVNSCCQFIGALNRAQVLNEMRLSDVFILPSLHETFGIVLGEAMACGKPVIATKCGGPEYVVTPETGILVEPGDPVALADAMESFMVGRRRFDSEKIRRSIVSRFGEEVFLNNISIIYESVLQDA